MYYIYILQSQIELMSIVSHTGVELSGSKNIEGFGDSRGEKDAELTESKEIEALVILEMKMMQN